MSAESLAPEYLDNALFDRPSKYAEGGKDRIKVGPRTPLNIHLGSLSIRLDTNISGHDRWKRNMNWS